ncbi:MAG: DoxX family protein [Candidatus Didemnitutus sp.]|nr:DoxX family protein [Candidatus Didemnitutus sp.]
MSEKTVAAPPAPFWSLAPYRPCALLPLRLIVGYGFLAHGIAKLQRGPELFIATLDGLGVPLAPLMGWLTIVVEVLGGLAVLLGAFTLLVSVPLAIILLVSIFAVHLPFGFSSIKLQSVTEAGPKFGQPGYEMSLLYLAGLVSLVLSGPGPWSIDRRREQRRQTSQSVVQ